MSGRNVQLKGLDLFVYLMERFNNTPEQALAESKVTLDWKCLQLI